MLRIQSFAPSGHRHSVLLPVLPDRFRERSPFSVESYETEQLAVGGAVTPFRLSASRRNVHTLVLAQCVTHEMRRSNGQGSPNVCGSAQQTAALHETRRCERRCERGAGGAASEVKTHKM